MEKAFRAAWSVSHGGVGGGLRVWAGHRQVRAPAASPPPWVSPLGLRWAIWRSCSTWQLGPAQRLASCDSHSSETGRPGATQSHLGSVLAQAGRSGRHRSSESRAFIRDRDPGRERAGADPGQGDRTPHGAARTCSPQGAPDEVRGPSRPTVSHGRGGPGKDPGGSVLGRPPPTPPAGAREVSKSPPAGAGLRGHREGAVSSSHSDGTSVWKSIYSQQDKT